MNYTEFIDKIRIRLISCDKLQREYCNRVQNPIGVSVSVDIKYNGVQYMSEDEARIVKKGFDSLNDSFAPVGVTIDRLIGMLWKKIEEVAREEI